VDAIIDEAVRSAGSSVSCGSFPQRWQVSSFSLGRLLDDILGRVGTRCAERYLLSRYYWDRM
jgi:hypothetical protein